MSHPVDTILSLVLLSILFSFGSSRLPVLIQLLAFQGIIVSLAPLIIGRDLNFAGIAFALITMAIRGIIIPLWLYLAVKQVSIRREIETTIGYHASILVGLGLIVGATYVSHRLHIPSLGDSDLLIPTAITTLAAGMFLLMARRNAIVMVLGYIMMENGIYLVGTTFSTRPHHIVEFGILLDVLAGVMIMAIILQSIKKEFDDMDTALLRSLKE